MVHSVGSNDHSPCRRILPCFLLYFSPFPLSISIYLSIYLFIYLFFSLFFFSLLVFLFQQKKLLLSHLHNLLFLNICIVLLVLYFFLWYMRERMLSYPYIFFHYQAFSVFFHSSFPLLTRKNYPTKLLMYVGHADHRWFLNPFVNLHIVLEWFVRMQPTSGACMHSSTCLSMHISVTLPIPWRLSPPTASRRLISQCPLKHDPRISLSLPKLSLPFFLPPSLCFCSCSLARSLFDSITMRQSHTMFSLTWTFLQSVKIVNFVELFSQQSHEFSWQN